MNTSTQFFSAEDNVPELLAQAAERMPAHVYCRAEGVEALAELTLELLQVHGIGR